MMALFQQLAKSLRNEPKKSVHRTKQRPCSFRSVSHLYTLNLTYSLSEKIQFVQEFFFYLYLVLRMVLSWPHNLKKLEDELHTEGFESICAPILWYPPPKEPSIYTQAVRTHGFAPSPCQQSRRPGPLLYPT